MFVKEINLDTDLSVFLDTDYDKPYVATTHGINELSDLHSKYGGFPSTFNDHNTIINQVWWDDSVEKYQHLGDQLGIEIKTISTIKQDPGQTNPVHLDMFYKIRKNYPDETRTIVRANIYLEDWKFGHVVQYNGPDGWHDCSGWRAGQGMMWDSTVEHVAGNIGMHPKYTLQLTGFLNE